MPRLAFAFLANLSFSGQNSRSLTRFCSSASTGSVDRIIQLVTSTQCKLIDSITFISISYLFVRLVESRNLVKKAESRGTKSNGRNRWFWLMFRMNDVPPSALIGLADCKERSPGHVLFLSLTFWLSYHSTSTVQVSDAFTGQLLTRSGTNSAHTIATHTTKKLF